MVVPFPVDSLFCGFCDVGFYVWGEGERWLPYGDMIKEWKVTKETNNPILHFLNGKHEVELNFTIAEHLGYKEKIPDTYFPTNDFNFVEKAGWTNIAIHVGLFIWCFSKYF